MKKNLIIASLTLLLLAGAALATGPHVGADIVDVVTKLSIGGGSYLTSSNQSGSGGYIVMTNSAAPTLAACLIGTGSAWTPQTCPNTSPISGILSADFAVQMFNANTNSTQQLKSISLSAGNVGSGNNAWIYRNVVSVLALNNAETVNLCFALSSSGPTNCSGISPVEITLSDGVHTSWNVTFQAECGTQGTGPYASSANCSYIYDVVGGSSPLHVFVPGCIPSGAGCPGVNTSGGVYEGMSVIFSTASTTNTAYDNSQIVIKEN